MIEQPRILVPRWFWVISVGSLLWNLVGFAIFLSEVFGQDAMMDSMTEYQKEWMSSIPSWVDLVFAIAVSTGVAGSICMLKRNASCVLLFSVSLVAVLIQMLYVLWIAGGLQVMGPSSALMPGLVILLSIAWLLFSLFFKGKGWLAPNLKASG